MFRSRNEWFAHELQCHRREWACQYCHHKAFTSASAYSNHLESSHPAIMGNSQLEALLLQSEEPVDKIASNACPLCDAWGTNLNHSRQDAKRLLLNNGEVVEPYGTPKQFRRHLGRHMEQLALFALPIREGDGLEDDSSDDDESDQKSAQINLRFEDDGEMQGLLRDIQSASALIKDYESTHDLEPLKEQVSDSKIKAQSSVSSKESLRKANGVLTFSRRSIAMTLTSIHCKRLSRILT
jgi:hypothetical protein